MSQCRDDEKNEEYKEKHSGYFGRRAGDARKPEDGGNDCHDKEDYGPAQHCVIPRGLPGELNIAGGLARRYGVLPCRPIRIFRGSTNRPIISDGPGARHQPQVSISSTQIGHLGGLKTELLQPGHVAKGR
jgi:hypothetical protein